MEKCGFKRFPKLTNFRPRPKVTVYWLVPYRSVPCKLEAVPHGRGSSVGRRPHGPEEDVGKIQTTGSSRDVLQQRLVKAPPTEH